MNGSMRSFYLYKKDIEKSVKYFMPYKYDEDRAILSKVFKLTGGGSTPARVIVYYDAKTKSIEKITLLSYHTEVIAVCKSDNGYTLNCYYADSQTTRKHIKLFLNEYIRGVDYKTTVKMNKDDSVSIEITRRIEL